MGRLAVAFVTLAVAGAAWALQELGPLEGLYAFTSVSKGSAPPTFEPCRRLSRQDVASLRARGFTCLETGRGEAKRAQYSCHRSDGDTFTEVWAFRTAQYCADAAREMSPGT